MNKPRYDKGLLMCTPSEKKKLKSMSISEGILVFLAALTNYHRLGGINNKHIFLIFLKAGKQGQGSGRFRVW